MFDYGHSDFLVTELFIFWNYFFFIVLYRGDHACLLCFVFDLNNECVSCVGNLNINFVLKLPYKQFVIAAVIYDDKDV